MMRWTVHKRLEIITLAAGFLILSGCGGSSSETPMPLEPMPHSEERIGQSHVVQSDDEPEKSPEAEANDAPKPN